MLDIKEVLQTYSRMFEEDTTLGLSPIQIITTRDLMMLDRTQDASSFAAFDSKYGPFTPVSSRSIPTAAVHQASRSPQQSLNLIPLTANMLRINTVLAPDSQGREIPLDAQWTMMKRSLVSAELFELSGFRYEARPAFIAVLGVMRREDIARLALSTTRIRQHRTVTNVKRKDRGTSVNAKSSGCGSRTVQEGDEVWDDESQHSEEYKSEGNLFGGSVRMQSTMPSSLSAGEGVTSPWDDISSVTSWGRNPSRSSEVGDSGRGHDHGGHDSVDRPQNRVASLREDERANKTKMNKETIGQVRDDVAVSLLSVLAEAASEL